MQDPTAGAGRSWHGTRRDNGQAREVAEDQYDKAKEAIERGASQSAAQAQESGEQTSVPAETSLVPEAEHSIE